MNSQFVLFAFGFGNLAMLGWLAAAAAPLLIHLWSRQRCREAPWAAMQFLLAAMRKNSRRLKLQQWLLLAMRTLIIVLVVLAVAEPYGERLLAGAGSAPAHRILILDGSFSMAYHSSDTTRFDRAKQLAADFVRDSGPADVFTVILMADSPKLVTGPAVDTENVATQIESLPQAHTVANLAATLAIVEDVLEQGGDERRSHRRQEVYFFTDLQRATWTSRSHAQRRDEERIAAIAKRAAVVVVDVGRSPSANLAVTRLDTGAPFVSPGHEIAFDATLRQFGEKPRTGCLVEFLVDDMPVGEQTIDVPSGSDATVRFKHRFNSAGSHTVAVRAEDDGLKVDNVRWLVVPVREELRLLCIEGKEGDARYISDALNPNPAVDSRIRPVVVSESELAELELAEFDCIFVTNVAQFTAGEAEQLRRYAAQGGGIVFFLGDLVVPDSYNALNAEGWDQGYAEFQADTVADSSVVGEVDPRYPAQPLLPARLGELITKTQFGLDPLDYRHPIVAPFRGRERAGLLTTPVSVYFRLELPAQPSGLEIAAALPNGDPFIIAAPFGRGRVIMVSTAASLTSIDSNSGEPWTVWPTWPSFLPIVRELLAYAMSGSQDDSKHMVGRPLGDTLTNVSPSRPSGTLAQVARPDGRTDEISLHADAEGLRWTYAETDISGIYSLRELPGTNNDEMQVAVNVDSRESDLSKVDSNDLPPEIQIRSTTEALSSDSAEVIARAGWNVSMLWAAFLLLLIESFVAWRFGRGVA